MIKPFLILVMLASGAINVGLIVWIYTLIAEHRGTDSAGAWFWIFMILNLGSFVKFCEWCFDIARS